MSAVDRRYRILLVEGDAADRKASDDFFGRNDALCRGSTAAGVEEAKALLAGARYDAVVTDCAFPDGTAFDLLPFVRESCVIFMGREGDEEAAAMALRAEACDFLVKGAGGGHLKALMMTVVRAVARRRVRREARMLSEAVRSIADAVFVSDAAGDIVFVNEAFQRMYGYDAREALREKPASLWRLPCGDPASAWQGETVHRRKDGSIFPVDYSRTLLKDGEDAFVVHVVRDVTEKKRVESEKEQLISELKGALAQVKKLSGLLPICANCKQIRDDKGSWMQIESYIAGHSEANFTHGVCPDCTRKLYPEYAEELGAAAVARRG